MAVRNPEVFPMDKELHPTIEGVQMMIRSDDNLILLRGDKGNYAFENIRRFDEGSPQYDKEFEGVYFYKYETASISISIQGSIWVASVE